MNYRQTTHLFDSESRAFCGGGGGGDTESEDRMQRDEVTLLGKELLGDEMIRVRRQCNNKHTAPGPFPGDSDSVGGAHGKSGFPFKFLS